MLLTIGGISERQSALLGVSSKAPRCGLAQLRAWPPGLSQTFVGVMTMSKQLNWVAAAALVVLHGVALAQEFPQGGENMSNGDIRKYVEDKVHDVKLADGSSWRLEYKSNGYFFINTSRGFNGDGQWQVEDGKLCGQLRGRDRTCNEVRLLKGVMHYKRDNGEIVQFVPR